MDKITKEIADGADAQRLLESTIYRESLGKVKDGLIKAMEESAMGDSLSHNRLVIALQLLAMIEKNIETVAMTGKLARMQMEQESVKQKIKRFVRK